MNNRLESVRKPETRLAYLDGLRGLAAVFVAMAHFINLYDFGFCLGRPENCIFGIEGWVARTPLNIPFQGNIMVQIFFVLSGYVLIKSFAENSSFLGAIARRYFRLAFPVLIACLVAWTINQSGFNFARQVMTLTGSSWLKGSQFVAVQLDFGEVISQALYRVFFTPPDDTWMLGGSLWTMRVEFSSSVMLIIFTIFLRSWKINPFSVLLVFTLVSWGYYQFFVLCGTWLYFLKEKGCLKEALSWGVFIPVFFFAILYASYPNENAPAFYKIFSFDETQYLQFSYTNPFCFDKCDRAGIFHGFGAVLILFLTIQSPFIQKVLSKFVFLGKISFPLYLLHLPLLFLTAGVFILTLKHVGPAWAFLITGIAFAYIALISSWLMYLAVEKPTIAWSKRLGERVDRFAEKD